MNDSESSGPGPGQFKCHSLAFKLRVKSGRGPGISPELLRSYSRGPYRPFRCDGADAAGVQPAAGTAHRLRLRRPRAARAPPPPPRATPTTERAATSAHFAWPSGLREADRLKGGPGALKSKSSSHA